MTDTEQQRPEPEQPSASIRTNLANERTFLAWIRTGMTFMALGLASAQLLDSYVVAGISLTRLLSVLLVALGGVLAVVGRWRYRQTAIAIRTGEFRNHRRALDVVVSGVLIVVVVAFALVWNQTLH